MFAGMAVGLVLLVGAGVDYTRAVQFKASLQSLADASALAGASAYVSATTGNTGISVATSYWNAGLSRLPPNSGVGTPSITTSSDASGYYVQVSVPASTIKTTFLSLIMNSIGVVVSAKAKDPIVSAGVDLSGWTSRAYDGNTMYWYDVPSDGSLPTFDTTHANQSGYNTAFHPFYTNIVNYTGAPLSTSFSVAAAQQIGFALVNVTGGSCPYSGCSPMTNYGSNGYGGSFNSVHVFFSQLNPPANSTYGYQPGPTLSGSQCNASLITAVVDPSNPYQTDPSAGAGVCQPAAANSVAAPSCAHLGTTSYRYFWNDMGGGRDDFDYNDAVYNFSCSSNGSPNTGVILTD
jgi:Flp pilus assembly protein TadG